MRFSPARPIHCHFDETLLLPGDYLERTRDVLERPDAWLAITRLASALLCRRSLTGEEVAGIVHDCGVTSDRAELPLGLRTSLAPDQQAAIGCQVNALLQRHRHLEALFPGEDAIQAERRLIDANHGVDRRS